MLFGILIQFYSMYRFHLFYRFEWSSEVQFYDFQKKFTLLSNISYICVGTNILGISPNNKE